MSLIYFYSIDVRVYEKFKNISNLNLKKLCTHFLHKFIEAAEL